MVGRFVRDFVRLRSLTACGLFDQAGRGIAVEPSAVRRNSREWAAEPRAGGEVGWTRRGESQLFAVKGAVAGSFLSRRPTHTCSAAGARGERAAPPGPLLV